MSAVRLFIIYNVLKAARGRLLTQKSSVNNRFKQARYGIKRLAKVELEIQQKLKKQAKRYNKSYPGEMVHVDTKRLPLLKGQKSTDRREYLFVATDDFWLNPNFGLIASQYLLFTS